MKLIILKPDQTREFTASVNVLSPGETEPQVCTVRFVELDRERLEQALTDADALLRRIVVHVDGLADAEGNDLPYSAEVLEALLRRAYVREALLRTYTDHITGERRLGN